jgi:hypothetical protein
MYSSRLPKPKMNESAKIAHFGSSRSLDRRPRFLMCSGSTTNRFFLHSYDVLLTGMSHTYRNLTQVASRKHHYPYPPIPKILDPPTRHPNIR